MPGRLVYFASSILDAMHTETNQKGSSVTNSIGAPMGSAHDSHFVFITDDSGIVPVFEQIKSKLGLEVNNCLTLVYSISGKEGQPLFKAELESIEKRFPAQLLTHYLFSGNLIPRENTDQIQQALEIILNCNLRKLVQFLVLGKADFIESVSERLHFLGIKPNQIYSQTF